MIASINCDKEGLYIALRSIDRLGKHLEDASSAIPDDIRVFLDEVWMVLKGEKARIALAKIDRQIGRLIVDEQDAGFEEALVNRLYYALSDLIVYLKESSALSVDYVLEEALEFWRYIAAHDYMSTNGMTGVLDEAAETEIESAAKVALEKASQCEDRHFASTVGNWSNINRR